MPDFVTVSVTNQIKTTNQNLISSPTDLLHSLQTLQTLMLYNHLANPLENNLLFCMSISCSEMDFFISTSEQVCPSDRKRTDGHINRTKHAEHQTGRKSRRGHRTGKGPMDTSTEQKNGSSNIRKDHKKPQRRKIPNVKQSGTLGTSEHHKAMTINPMQKRRFPMSNNQGHWERTDIAKQ